MPTVSQVHINAAMTELSIKYGQGGYIADKLFPVVPVKKQSDYYFIFDSAREALRQTDDSRAPGAEAREVDYAITSATYSCEDHALKDIIPDEVRANADAAIQPEIDTTEFLTDKIMLNKEIACQSDLSTALASYKAVLAGTAGTTSNPLYYWSDYTNGDPYNNVIYGKGQIRAAIQKDPNTLICPIDVFEVLCNHPDIIDRIKYGGTPGAPGVITSAQALAQLFQVDQVLIPNSFKNTAIKGQTAAVSAVWGDDCYLAYVEPRAGLKKISLGYTMVWNINGTMGYQVDMWREDARKGDWIQVSRYYDQKIVAATAAWKIENCVE